MFGFRETHSCRSHRIFGTPNIVQLIHKLFLKTKFAGDLQVLFRFEYPYSSPKCSPKLFNPAKIEYGGRATCEKGVCLGAPPSSTLRKWNVMGELSHFPRAKMEYGWGAHPLPPPPAKKKCSRWATCEKRIWFGGPPSSALRKWNVVGELSHFPLRK